MTQWGCFWRRECIGTNLSFVLSRWTHPKLDLNSLFICGAFKHSVCTSGLCMCTCACILTQRHDNSGRNSHPQSHHPVYSKWMKVEDEEEEEEKGQWQRGKWPYSGFFTLCGLFSLCIFGDRSLHSLNQCIHGPVELLRYDPSRPPRASGWGSRCCPLKCPTIEIITHWIIPLNFWVLSIAPRITAQQPL